MWACHTAEFSILSTLLEVTKCSVYVDDVRWEPKVFDAFALPEGKKDLDLSLAEARAGGVNTFPFDGIVPGNELFLCKLFPKRSSLVQIDNFDSGPLGMGKDIDHRGSIRAFEEGHSPL
ncbi:uncharacterized protein Z518_05390 [Rhinocladiella mackenziei CBS 650.93]|uniref:Uncharacterized protein n=1 Tax=Rhinocladiella mackenziei CBS 650.93 TaxID=1442369 RepID=A0A0D2J674_9EURO|nr:uncharacterized protein Z518_05390 [Rhinocladiella mackenziei CBS 650.93]KIX04520.1 hypothetical protein Z518_05390 [Rhinocladiella mackenziei CBS 650.93]